MPGLFFLALAGGFITVLSPCVLPVLPILLGIGGGKSPRRPLMIIAGFVASFSALGAAFATAGTLLGIGNAAFRLVAVALLILFGAALIFEGLYERAAARFQAFLSRLGARLSGGAALKTDAASGFVLGASLAIVWTPCAGPILGTILTLASRTMDYATTVLLMFAYSLGASGPMLAIAYGGGAIRRWIAGLGAWQRVFNVVFGVLVIATAILIFTGEDVALEARLLDFGRSSNNTAIAPVPSTLPVLADRMPEFANVTAWLNSEPLTPVTLKGKVVLVDFWTYSCINCIRTLPYVEGWYEKYKNDGFIVVGVHTPEFAFEKDVNNVKAAVARDGIIYPVALDNDYGTWNNYDNQYWPAEYLFDAQGRLRYTHFGEGDDDRTEAAIRSLLAEAGAQTNAAVSAATTTVDFSKIGSPETYIGYERQEYFESPESVVRDAPQTYSIAATPSLNRFSLGGSWTIEAQRATLDTAPGAIAYRYSASNANLVMGAPAFVRAEITLDGAPVPAALRGADIIEENGNTEVRVKDERLYDLIDAKGTYGEHVLRIRFLDAGVHAYAFTFG